MKQIKSKKGTRVPCTADCEYLGDFISKLNEE